MKTKVIYAGFAVIIFILAWFLVRFITILIDKPAIANAYIAIATLTLALVTAILALISWWNIYNSNQRERRRREDEGQVRKEEKERNFKKQCMDDLFHWAQNGAILLAELRPSHDMSAQRMNLERIIPLQVVNNWMMNVSRQLDEKQLPKIVDKAAESLKQYVDFLQNRGLGGDDLHERCRESFVKLLEHLANLKVKLQL